MFCIGGEEAGRVVCARRDGRTPQAIQTVKARGLDILASFIAIFFYAYLCNIFVGTYTV